MKTAHKLILALFAAAILTTCTATAYAEDDPWADDNRPALRGKKIELTEEKVDEIMAELAETNPAKAELLEKLRKENPDIFKAQIKRIAIGKSRRDNKGRMGQPGMNGRDGQQMPGRRSSRGGRGGRGDGMVRQQETETLEWLEKNDPDSAKELLELKQENRKLYVRKMSYLVKKYRKIMEAEKTNPALAAVLKEDLELKSQTGILMKKIRGTSDDKEKQELKSELEVLTGKRFDLIIKKKQLQYEDLLKKLEELKNSIKESEAEMENLKGKKADHIKERVEALINKTEEIRWE